jgi:chemotaxis signal transduction protein
VAEQASSTRTAETRILDDRARALARPAREEEQDESDEFVVACFGPERYAVPVKHVVEVLPGPAVTPVSGTGPEWAGIVNVRGTLYPVLDLATYLGLASAGASDPPGDRTMVLVTAGGSTVGLLADEIPGIRRLPEADIAAAPPSSRGPASNALRGLTSDLLTILDVENLLADPRLSVRKEST